MELKNLKKQSKVETLGGNAQNVANHHTAEHVENVIQKRKG